MKIILITFLIIGCTKENSKEEERNFKLDMKEAKLKVNKYIGKCYKHWHGNIKTWREYKFPWLKLCNIENICDISDKNKCINTMSCFKFIRYDYVEKTNRKWHLEEEIKCPKGINKK